MRFTGPLPPVHRLLLVAACLVLFAACSSGGGSASPSTGYGAPLSNSTARAGGAAGAGAVASATSGSRASAAPADVVINVTTMMQLGSFLTDAAGRTLYVFRKDGPDSSACTGACATAWPALTVAAGGTTRADPAIGARLGTFQRPDGSMQVAFDKEPLYYFSGDSKAGDTNGQGIGGAWFVAAVSGAAPAGSTSPGSISPGSTPSGSPSPAGAAPTPSSGGS